MADDKSKQLAAMNDKIREMKKERNELHNELCPCSWGEWILGTIVVGMMVALCVAIVGAGLSAGG